MKRICSLLRSVDLRFQDKAEEVRFTAHIESKVVFSTGVLSALVVLGCVFTIEAQMRTSDRPDIWAAGGSRSCSFWTTVSTCLGSLVVCSFSVFWLRFGCLKLLNWEVTVSTMMSSFVFAMCMGNQYTSAKLYGEDPGQMWTTDPRASEGAVALTVDAITTVICLFIPIRFHLKSIPPIVGLLSFCFCFGVLGSPFPHQLFSNIFKLVALTLCALCGAWRTEAEVRQNYMAQIIVQKKSKELEVQHAGAFRILDCLCDSLLELGSDFSICEPNPRLAAMLFFPRDMRGDNFRDLIASEEDQLRFADALLDDSGVHEPIDVKSSSSMVQISLRDFHGREFGVYLYHARTFGLAAEESGHMVAIVEAQERIPPDAFHSPEVNREWLDLQQSAEVDASRSSGSESEFSMVEHSEDVAVWINVVSPAFEIVRCSAGFTVFGPIAVGDSFMNKVEDSEAFALWVQRLVNRNVASGTVKCEPITLKLRVSTHSQAEFSTNCMLDLSTFRWDARADCVVLRLVFDHVKYRHRRYGSSRNGARSLARRPPIDIVGRRLLSL